MGSEAITVLVMTMCLVDDPTKCQRLQEPYNAAVMSISACFVYGEQRITQYVLENPKWKIEGYTCTDAIRHDA